MHIMVSGGIAIAAVGGSNLYTDASSPSKVSTDRGLLKAGYLILLLVIILLIAHAIVLVRSVRNTSAITLLHWVLVAILFLAIRVIYSVVYAFTGKPSLSPLTGTFAIKFVLIFLVQLIAACCLVVGGFVTRNMNHDGLRRSDEEVVMH
jgi:hypothetical protein